RHPLKHNAPTATAKEAFTVSGRKRFREKQRLPLPENPPVSHWRRYPRAARAQWSCPAEAKPEAVVQHRSPALEVETCHRLISPSSIQLLLRSLPSRSCFDLFVAGPFFSAPRSPPQAVVTPLLQLWRATRQSVAWPARFRSNPAVVESLRYNK